jgi:hypothetical protein
MRSTIIRALLVSVCTLFSLTLRADVPTHDLAVTFQKGGSLTTDEVAALMGGFIWKMEVTLPQGTKTISVGAERGGIGNKCNALTGTIGTSVADATKKPIILVAVFPLNGSITSAAKLRISLLIRTVEGAGTGDAGTAGEVDNPLRNAAGFFTSTPPKEVARGEFDLIEGQECGVPIGGKNASTPLAAIRLHISAN